MSELRAPDPTLSHLAPDESVWIDDTHPRVAHRSSRDPGCCQLMWHEEAQDAQWFAVPCTSCFPDAPPRGTDPLNRPKAGMYLSWQTA